MKGNVPAENHRTTRSGVRRAGDDYQDILAAELLVNWLASPQKCRYVVLENSKAGSLDDSKARLRRSLSTLLGRRF